MIRSLSLKNFQAWPKVDLELSPITVIIGETNAGKSSLLRGLACVLFNAMEGQGMVRQGATVAEVTLETEEGNVITWARGANVNRYTLDGQLYDKPGRVVPLPVQEALQIHELEFDGETVRLQWAPQMDAPFLLADSGVKATRMLGVAGNAAVVAQAARLAHQETKDQQDALRSALTQLESLNTQLDGFKDVTDAQPIADALRQVMVEERETAAKLRVLQDLYTRHLAAQPRRAEATAQLATAKELVARLTDWSVLQRRQETLLAGTALRGRHAHLSARLVLAESLQEAWRQRHRLEELKGLFTTALEVRTRRESCQGKLEQALTHREVCQHQHDAIVAALTCPTCGRVKEAA